MKQLLTATALAAMLILTLARVVTAADGRPIVDAPRTVRVGDVFTITLRCNCTGAEDTVWWYSKQVEFISGWPNPDADRATEFDSNRITTMRVRATNSGRIEIWASWLNYDGKLWQNLQPIAVHVEPAQTYLPMLISPQRSFEIPQ